MGPGASEGSGAKEVLGALTGAGFREDGGGTLPLRALQEGMLGDAVWETHSCPGGSEGKQSEC